MGVLTGARGAGLTVGVPSAATGPITNGATSAVSVAVSPPSAAQDGATNLVYTFTRNNTSSQTPALTVSFTVGGTASFSMDYAQRGAASFSTTTVPVTFAAGSATATVTINQTTDSIVEPDETAVLTVP